jgi:hypothetical protein
LLAPREVGSARTIDVKRKKRDSRADQRLRPDREEPLITMFGIVQWWKHLYVLVALISMPAHAQRVDVARFSDGNLDGWTSRSFVGKTRYELTGDAGRRVLHARSSASASGLYRTVRVNLAETPYLHWSWRIGRPLDIDDERQKRGDDFQARVYVVFARGPLLWRTRAINYVWSSQQPANAMWPNPFTANAWMIAVRSGPAVAEKSVSESRNVLEDYRRVFGEEPGAVSAVALMSDSDNSGLATEAWFGDAWFAAK